MWWHKCWLKIVLCGDINVDYLTEDVKKRQLSELLLTYNLTPIVHFPTRTLGSSSTAIDNIFLDTNTFYNYTVSPQYNGLADHDALLLTINNLNLQLYSHCTHTTRSLNTYSKRTSRSDWVMNPGTVCLVTMKAQMLTPCSTHSSTTI